VKGPSADIRKLATKDATIIDAQARITLGSPILTSTTGDSILPVQLKAEEQAGVRRPH